MTVTEFLEKLVEVWPGSFTGQKLDALAPAYRQVLMPLGEQKIQEVWDRLAVEWPHAYAPKPAHCADMARVIQARSASGGGSGSLQDRAYCERQYRWAADRGFPNGMEFYGRMLLERHGVDVAKLETT